MMFLFMIHFATIAATVVLVVLSHEYLQQSRRTGAYKRKHPLSIAGMVALYPVAFASILIDLQWSVHDAAVGPVHLATEALELMVTANKSVKMALIIVLCIWVRGAVLTLRQRKTTDDDTQKSGWIQRSDPHHSM